MEGILPGDEFHYRLRIMIISREMIVFVKPEAALFINFLMFGNRNWGFSKNYSFSLFNDMYAGGA